MRFLVVEDEESVGAAMGKLLAPYGQAVHVRTVKEAHEQLAHADAWNAFFIDVRLPDGSGIELLARARLDHPHTPAMVLSGGTDPRVINAAFDLDAHFVAKPVRRARIAHFLMSHPGFSERLERATLAWQTRYRLSVAEADVLRRAALGETREAIATARECSLFTVKGQIAGVMRKTGDGSLSAAVGRLLREVAGNDGAGSV